MRSKIIFFLFIGLTTIKFNHAQTGSVGIGTTNPNNSAALEIQSTSKGLLLPRLSTAQRNAIVSPAAGLLVFDTNKNCLYFFDGSKWQAINTAASSYSLPFTEGEVADGEQGDLFGTSVGISGNYAIIGAPGDKIGSNTAQGSAYIFFKDGNNWIQQAKLTASDGSASDAFGSSVAISGDFAVVGSPQDDLPLPIGTALDRGSIYVFRRNGTVWTQFAKLTSNDGAQGDIFGNSVSISGNYIIVGAEGADIGGNSEQGAAYIFFYNGTSWSQQSKLFASDGAALDDYGYSVSIHGNYAVVGAPDHAVDGAAYIYFRFGTVWVFDQMIPEPGIPPNSNFGSSVQIFDTLVIVGANTEDFNGMFNTGAAWIFERNGTLWNGVSHLQALDRDVSDNFGMHVGIFGNFAIVGVPLDDLGALPDHGSAYLYRRDGFWRIHHKIEIPGSSDIMRLGSSVSMDGNNIIIGAASSMLGKGKVFFMNLE